MTQEEKIKKLEEEIKDLQLSMEALKLKLVDLEKCVNSIDMGLSELIESFNVISKQMAIINGI